MKRTLVLAALLALLLPIRPARATGAYDGIYCGGTGWNLNTGATTQSFMCRPSRLVRGVGTITYNAASATVTCDGGPCFTNIAAIDAVPAAGNFFNRSGFQIYHAGFWQWFNVVARTSDVSIDVNHGNRPVADITGTSQTWAYWNTTCYYQNAAHTVTNNQSASADQRLWDVLGSATYEIRYPAAPVVIFGLVDSGSTISTTNFFEWVRPVTIKQFGTAGTAQTYGSNTSGTVKIGPTGSAGNMALMTLGVEYTLVQQTTAAAAYAYVCAARGES